MYKSILVIAFIAAATSAAVAREVCQDEQVRQINCTTVNGKQNCTVTYVTAQRCHQEPDKPGKAAAAGQSNQIMEADDGSSRAPKNRSNLLNKQILFVQ